MKIQVTKLIEGYALKLTFENNGLEYWRNFAADPHYIHFFMGKEDARLSSVFWRDSDELSDIDSPFKIEIVPMMFESLFQSESISEFEEKFVDEEWDVPFSEISDDDGLIDIYVQHDLNIRAVCGEPYKPTGIYMRAYKNTFLQRPGDVQEI